MPDGDVFNRVAARGWAKPLRKLCRLDEPQEVTRAILKSLALALREQGGIPGRASLLVIITTLSRGRLSYRDALMEIRKIERDAATTEARIVARAAEQMVASMAAGVTSLDLERDFVERSCGAIVDHHVFGKAGPELFDSVADSSAGEVNDVRVLVEDGIQALARQLLRRQDSDRLRAPSMYRRNVRSTADMLHEPLE